MNLTLFFQAARFNADGSSDPSFGITTYALGGTSAGFDTLCVQGQRLYVGGDLKPAVTSSDVSDVVARPVIDRIFSNGFQ